MQQINDKFATIFYQVYKLKWDKIKLAEKKKNGNKNLENKNLKKVRKLLNAVLDYEGFNKKKGWNRHEFWLV